MRVLIVADVIGGVRTFTAEVTRALAALGHEVHLALIGPAVGAEWVQRAGAASCEVADLRLEWMQDPWDDVAAASEWVGELAARHSPDVLHMNTFTPVSDPSVPVVVSAHSCVLSWWHAVHGTDAPGRWDRYRDLAGASLARAQAVVAPTRALMDELGELYPLPRDARVIANGRRVVPERALRQALTVTVGRLWDPAKNVALVAAAAPSVQGRVVAIGAGEIAGIENTGELSPDEVLSWLSRARVFAEPARYEPFGLSALEAAQCGCALVLGDIPSLREVWGDAAAYVPTEDPPALAAAINGLLRHPGRRAAAARAAGTRAMRYAPEVMARAYLDAYAAVAEAASSPVRVPA